MSYFLILVGVADGIYRFGMKIFSGQWTLVGYHDDGSLKPARFEGYAEFQKRTASR